MPMNEINRIYVSQNIYSQTKTLFRLPEVSIHFPYHPDTFRIIRILFGSSEHFSGHPDHQETSHIIQTYFGSSGHFLDHTDTFQSVWILCRLSGPFFIIQTLFKSWDHQDTFWIVQSLFIPCGYFSDHTDTCRSSGHFADHP